jgi:transcriptional regulator
MDRDQGVSLVTHGDQFEQDTWTKLEPYLSKYEMVWRMHVVPLRNAGSVYLRSGIDADLETFAMNNYTAYVNIARALEKIDSNADDLKYAEEIWANLQRAVEVAKKAEAAFSKVYRECTRKDARIDTQRLECAEESVKTYRNHLHDPIPATLKDEYGNRLIPSRDKLEKYSRWTTTMYDHDLSDFRSVESQLRDDFYRVCSALQELWKQIESLSEGLLELVSKIGSASRQALTLEVAELLSFCYEEAAEAVD